MSSLGINVLSNFSSDCNNFLWVTNEGEGCTRKRNVEISLLASPKPTYASRITIVTIWVSSICIKLLWQYLFTSKICKNWTFCKIVRNVIIKFRKFNINVISLSNNLGRISVRVNNSSRFITKHYKKKAKLSTKITYG